LHHLICEYHTVHVKKHCTPLHNLLDQFSEIYPDRVESIAPNQHPNTHTNTTFITEIAQDRDSSMQKEADSLLEIKIFTDGSAIDQKVGAAAVMYRRGKSALSRVLRYHLGGTDEYTSFKAEAVGAIMGIWMIRSEHIAGCLLISVLTDSQAFIKQAVTCNTSLTTS